MDFRNAWPARAIRDVVLAPAGKIRPSSPPRWMQLYPPTAIEYNRLELALANLPASLNGLRIVHLSDFHFQRHWPAAMDLLLDHIRRNPPDLLLLTGDFVENKCNFRPAMPLIRRLLTNLTSRFGCFAIHGNHDSYKIGRELSDLPVTFLDGRRRVVPTPGGDVELIGLPGKHRIELTPAVLAGFPPRQAEVPRIVLSHFPDHLQRTGGLDADVFLAGHTHGGQLCLPNCAPLLTHDALPRRMCKGAHRIGNTWLVVSRGLGFTGLPIRMFCPPEAIEILLRPDLAQGPA